MTPEEIRDAKWTEIENQVTGQREMVYTSLLACGRCTTEALAAAMEKSVLSVRPRVSELYDLGLVALVGKDGHNGIYEAIPVFAARQQHEVRRAARVSQGTQLTLL
jgi:hypothetical protein